MESEKERTCWVVREVGLPAEFRLGSTMKDLKDDETKYLCLSEKGKCRINVKHVQVQIGNLWQEGLKMSERPYGVVTLAILSRQKCQFWNIKCIKHSSHIAKWHICMANLNKLWNLLMEIFYPQA